MAVPLQAGGRLLGVLDVQSQERQAFTEDDVRAVEAIGNELAFALASSRKVRETQDELQKVDSLYRGRARKSWARFARAGVPTLLRVGGDGTQGPSALGDEAFRTGHTTIDATGREVAVAVVVRGEVVATIAARRSPTDPAWSADDVALLEVVSGQIGLSLENARQYSEEQRRVSELEVVNRVSQGVSQMLRLDSLFRVVYAQIDQILPGVDVSIGLYTPAADSIEYPFVSQAGEFSERPALALGQDLAAQVLRTRQPLLLSENVAQQAAVLGVRTCTARLGPRGASAAPPACGREPRPACASGGRTGCWREAERLVPPPRRPARANGRAGSRTRSATRSTIAHQPMTTARPVSTPAAASTG